MSNSEEVAIRKAIDQLLSMNYESALEILTKSLNDIKIKSFQKDLENKLDKAAEYDRFDDCRVLDVVEQMFKRFKDTFESSDVNVRARILCNLAAGIQRINPHMKHYDFNGDDIINEMDEIMMECVDDITDPDVLNEVAEYFSTNAYSEFNKYGLFENTNLSSGRKAEMLFKEYKTRI